MRDDRYRLQQIVETGDGLLALVNERGITKGDVMVDESIQWMLTTPLIHIGEQANRLSNYVTDNHPDIPWAEVAGLRHRLVHDYEDTNWNIICSVIFDKLPPFVESVRGVLKEL